MNNIKPFQSLYGYLTKGRIEWAIKQTKSISQASKLCEVSYNTFRKYAKLYKNDEGISLFEEFKNQPGKGINKPKNMN
jgi:transposase|tara:strand:- start:5273 stop:5506 length:234 start_codon:yes stop_codon:yes gene_type:complete